MQAGWDEPDIVAKLGQVERAAVVCEVGQDDAEIDGTGEEAGAETTDGCRGDFGNINRTIVYSLDL